MTNNVMKEFIRQQPELLSSLLRFEKDAFPFLEQLPTIHKIVIVASGTSHNAAEVVSACFSEYNLSIKVITPFQLQHYRYTLQDCDLLIAISHTGKSSGTIHCAQCALDQGIPVVIISGDASSPLSKIGTYAVDIHCGDEPIGPKTKGFTCTCVTLHLFLLQLLEKQNILCKEEGQLIRKELQDTIDTIPSIITQAEAFAIAHKEWSQAPCLSVIGYGVNYGSACEGNLKLLETMRVPAMNYELEEFMHGAHRTIDEHSYLIFLHTHGVGYDLMSNLLSFAKPLTPHILVADDHSEQCDIRLPFAPKTKAYLAIAIIPHVLASILPEYKGINPSNPVHANFATTAGTRVN